MNLSPHASASFCIPEKSEDGTVAENLTSIPTTSHRLFSIAKSTSFRGAYPAAGLTLWGTLDGYHVPNNVLLEDSNLTYIQYDAVLDDFIK